jgi:RecB family exonuclease
MDSYLTNIENPTKYPKVSVSELTSFTRCKRQHYYGYGLGLKPRTTPGYFTKGGFLHQLMAALLSGHKDNESLEIDDISRKLQREAIASGDPTVDEPTRLELVEQTTRFWSEVSKDDFKIVDVEREFYADVGWLSNSTPVLLHGFIDALVMLPNSDLWVVEHKTASRAWSTAQFHTSYQGKLYSEAVFQTLGVRPAGIQYNFFYPKRYEVRQQFVTEEESWALIDEVQSIVSLRDFTYQHKVWPREPLFGCGGCQFFDLCWGELSGVDAEGIIAANFTVDEEKKARYDVEE